MSVHLVFDFEYFQQSEWQSIGIVVFEQGGDGRVRAIDQFHTSCERDPHTMSPRIKSFWAKHRKALEYNLAQGRGKTPHEEEQNICAFIDALKTTTPNFYLISDTPENDVAMMNNILHRHGSPPMSHRSSNMYFQTVCVWSSKRILKLLGVHVPRVNVVDFDDAVVRYRHTPIYDCFRIMNAYMCVMMATMTR